MRLLDDERPWPVATLIALLNKWPQPVHNCVDTSMGERLTRLRTVGNIPSKLLSTSHRFTHASVVHQKKNPKSGTTHMLGHSECCPVHSPTIHLSVTSRNVSYQLLTIIVVRACLLAQGTHTQACVLECKVLFSMWRPRL
jgi:hypothetical protein